MQMLIDQLSASELTSLTKMFALLSNPIRLQILDYLMLECCIRKEGCCSVTDIYTNLQLPQPLISKHLKLLKESGVLCYYRSGNKIMYSFDTSSSIRLIKDFVARLPESGLACCAQN